MRSCKPVQYLRVFIVSAAVSLALLRAQAPPDGQTQADRTVPIYRLTVVQRALQAVNFQRHSGPTRIDFKGTVLLPKADGEAKVEVKNGYTQINANFRHLDPPTQFGTEYLTYVLWAITPEGRGINLGEVVADSSNKASMRVTCPYSTFGLLVTAEPYFSVPYPSDVVVLESAVRPDTVGTVQQVQAKYELLPRGQYTLNIKPQELPSASMKAERGVSMTEYEAVLELYQARNAVQIAKADGAAEAAPDTFNKAQLSLSQAESLYAARKDFNGVINTARQAVQAASDARVIAMRKKTAAEQH
ncbi:MAG: hypothetical protein ACJ74Z_08105 [Bryobacteraceae bacterium]